MKRSSFKRLWALIMCAAMALQFLGTAALAAEEPAEPAAEEAIAEETITETARTLAATDAQAEPTETVVDIPWKAVGEGGGVIETTVEQHTFTFTTIPKTYEEISQYKLDSPYKTMALMILAYRLWTEEHPEVCWRMLDYLVDTETYGKFSENKPWQDSLKDRMTQNDKYRYIGNAYLGGATPENDYEPATPITITLRQSAYVPYAYATETEPELHQILISIPGAENDRYAIFYQDAEGNWKIYQREWLNLLTDVQPPYCDRILPAAYEVPVSPTNPQTEPTETVTELPWKAVGEDGEIIDTSVEQHTFTFTTIPETYEDIVQYKLDSPYKTMALMYMALRTWKPGNHTDCEQMLSYLTNTAADSGLTDENGRKLAKPFSDYNPWITFLTDRMEQNDKWRYIGNAYLGGANPHNDYTPGEPITVTLRQSPYVPFAPATAITPALEQVLIQSGGSENERYSLLYQDERGDWRFWSDNWKSMLVDVIAPDCDLIHPPAYVVPTDPANPQFEPVETVTNIPWKAAAVDENGEATVVDTTVEQHTFTFSTIPTCYEDIVQYKLDSPYKTMALYFLALRTWTKEHPEICAQMLDYLTNTGWDTGEVDAQGRKLAKPFSQHQPWTDFLRDRMKQNEKYRYIGNAYLAGATPDNDYTPTLPITITLRQSTYVPYAAGTAVSPTIEQVLVQSGGSQNERYGLLYQDSRGDWRFWSDNWKGLLADVQKPASDYLLPPEYTVPENPAHPQVEPTETIFEIPAKVPGVDDAGNEIIMDTTVKQHTFTFSKVPTCYEDIVQYKLDSPYKTMALLFLAFRTWTPTNKTDCLQMLDYLTFTNADSGKTDANGRKLARKFSDYQFWTDFVRDRMTQNNKYPYIGNAYLDGATPTNNYTPNEPISITVRESVYNPYHAAGINDDDPEITQVLIDIPGADNSRYSLFYKDQRGDYRVWSDNWKGLLVDIKTPSAEVAWPAEVERSATPAHPQTEPALTINKIPAKAVGENDEVIDTTVDEYKFTFSTIPTCYEDIVQYKLDSPYKTMALYFLALRTWTPENPNDCAEMLAYLTNTAVEKPGVVDGAGHKLCYPFNEYNPWIAFLKDRMTQNNKYPYLANAYLGGATVENGYTPTTPITVTLRQSVYDPYKAAAETTPELKQVLISFEGDDSLRYSLFYQDQRGDWRFFGDNWKGLLAEIKKPGSGEKNAESYVERAYSVILGREGDEGGVEHWKSELENGASAGEIVKEFFRSGEYQSRNLSKEETVRLCYQTMLGRDPSAGEIANWTALLNDGYSTTKLVAEFVASEEFGGICAEYGLNAGTITLDPRDQNGNISRFVDRCYMLSLGRAADEGGLNEWANHLLLKDLTPERVAFGFIFSDEAKKKGLDDEAFIRMLYKMMLDREPDAGVANWVASLSSLTEAEVAWANASGERTAEDAVDKARQDIYASFAASEEFALMCKNFGF